MIIYNINDKDFYIVNICTETGDSTVISITKDIFQYLKNL